MALIFAIVLRIPIEEDVNENGKWIIETKYGYAMSVN